eukprot:COSAG01_NODE_3124_length_6550_cov_213.272981_10_plen_131_part_00
MRISEPNELEDFPWDRQDFMLTLYLKQGTHIARMRSLSELSHEQSWAWRAFHRHPVSVSLPHMDTEAFQYNRECPYKYRLHNKHRLRLKDSCAAIEIGVSQATYYVWNDGAEQVMSSGVEGAVGLMLAGW